MLQESYWANPVTAIDFRRETKETFMHVLTDSLKETLENAIRVSIAPVSIIISDMWSSYVGMEELMDMNCI